jgi:hypothetical protein
MPNNPADPDLRFRNDRLAIPDSDRALLLQQCYGKPEPLMGEFVPDHTGSIPNDRVVDHFFGSHKTHAVFYMKRYLCLKGELANEAGGMDYESLEVGTNT